ncbi:unnamed protein product, partial [Ectocarpus sp. 12 AP-2014]
LILRDDHHPAQASSRGPRSPPKNPGTARDQSSAWTTLVQGCRLALNGVCVHEEEPSPSSCCFACNLVKSSCGGGMCENPCLLS